jgi:uncharacterized protein
MKNAIVWSEIPVTDMKKAAALYEATLGVKLELSDFGGVPHAVFPYSDNTVSGALVVDAKRKRGAGTTIYLATTDGVASSLARAVEAGAKVVQPMTSIAPHGSIALIEDFDGNVVGLHQEQAK